MASISASIVPRSNNAACSKHAVTLHSPQVPSRPEVRQRGEDGVELSVKSLHIRYRRISFAGLASRSAAHETCDRSVTD